MTRWGGGGDSVLPEWCQGRDRSAAPTNLTINWNNICLFPSPQPTPLFAPSPPLCYPILMTSYSLRQYALDLGGGERAIDKYLALSEDSDPDYLAIKTMILRDGTSAYQAARRRFESGKTNRSWHTIRWHTRDILRDIFTYFGGDIDKSISELQHSGATCIPYDAATFLREALAEQGVKVEEDVRFRVRQGNAIRK